MPETVMDARRFTVGSARSSACLAPCPVSCPLIGLGSCHAICRAIGVAGRSGLQRPARRHAQ
eukprot:14036149-Alexandrium_andersonii.AAC.1